MLGTRQKKITVFDELAVISGGRTARRRRRRGKKGAEAESILKGKVTRVITIHKR